ncbi:hypothetical protein [Marivirga lumbricoides]|uniref:hypothetical protein n=1 Tax=Marivirga lumbricoides TaxID=1046115 RepID=UPI0016646671
MSDILKRLSAEKDALVLEKGKDFWRKDVVLFYHYVSSPGLQTGLLNFSICNAIIPSSVSMHYLRS